MAFLYFHIIIVFMISIKSLRIDYEDVNAVNDLDLEIHEGQIYGLVGPNGAGKTSTIKALAGILEPTYGEIKIAGFDLELDHEMALQNLGYMPDFPPVYENLKVWEYLDVFAAAYLIPHDKRPEKINHWLKRVNLMEKYNTFISDLSRGMRQRLVLAKTLLHDPKVLLLDEPASGLDPKARKDMRDILKAVAREKKTIIISSHILTELSDFCNAVGIMEKGRMVVSGSIEDIRARIGSNKHLVIRQVSENSHNHQKIFNFLNNSQHCSAVESKSATEIYCLFSGTREDAAWILAQLALQETGICDFYCEEDDVEDIFFKIGAQEVS